MQGEDRFPLVWFHVKGYPYWPGVVISIDDVPEHKAEV